MLSIFPCILDIQIRSDQSLSRVRFFVTPWIAARQASLSPTNSRSSLRLMSIESVMPSSHLILCRPLLLLPPIPPSIRVFSKYTIWKYFLPFSSCLFSLLMASFAVNKLLFWHLAYFSFAVKKLLFWHLAYFSFCCLWFWSHIQIIITKSFLPGILQVRTLDWVAISFSSAWKWKVKVKSPSCVQLLATPWTAAYQAPPSMGFSRQEYWSGVPLPSLHFPNIFCFC